MIRRSKFVVLAVATVICAALPLGMALAKDVTPEGLFSLTPVLERSCVAVRVPVGKGEALAGIRWFNNDSGTSFPKVLIASGLKDLPPLFEDGLVVWENLEGVESGWSEAAFDEAIGSDTGTLYVIFQLPANTQGTEAGEGPGFAYVKSKTGSGVYISADGDDWTKMGSDYQLLVDPVYTDSGSAGVMLKCSQGGGDEASDSVPEIVVEKTELLHPYPNPFNPVTNIDFALKNPGSINLVVFDIRGRRVKVLESGHRDMGHHTVSWFGDNSSGQRVASGVYFVRLEADGQNMIKRMLLVK